MSFVEKFATNNGVKIHYIDGNETIDNNLTPLLHIPGGFSGAETFLPDMPFLSPRRCISMAQRGRGKSDAPNAGYSFELNISDVEAVVLSESLGSIFLYAFSFAVPSAVGYAIKNPSHVKGIILGDYPARYPSLKEEWVEKYERLQIPGVNLDAVRAVQRESQDVSLWDSLYKIQCPVLVLRGGNKNADPKPILQDEESALYQKGLANVSFVTFEQTGHRLWEPDHSFYINTIRDFLTNND